MTSINDYSSSFDTTYLVTLCIIALIAGVVWGVVVYNIMKKKGYQSLGGWFCCGFFLGLIGLIIAITRPDKSMSPFQNGNPYGQPPYPNQQFPSQPPYNQPMQPPYGQPMQGQPMQGQPMQGQPMQPPYGQPMQPPYNSQPTPQNIMPGQMAGIRCQQCGMMNAPGTVYCSACGNKVQ